MIRSCRPAVLAWLVFALLVLASSRSMAAAAVVPPLIDLDGATGTRTVYVLADFTGSLRPSVCAADPGASATFPTPSFGVRAGVIRGYPVRYVVPVVGAGFSVCWSTAAGEVLGRTEFVRVGQ